MLNESKIKRLKKLAGILNEDVSFIATTGRSDKGTLSWHIENYLISVAEDIVNVLDSEVEKDPSLNLFLSKKSTKILPNSIVIKLIIKDSTKEDSQEEEFLITLTADIENTSNTVASITYENITNKINLSSKHSEKDLSIFKREIIDHIINSIKLKNK